MLIAKRCAHFQRKTCQKCSIGNANTTKYAHTTRVHNTKGGGGICPKWKTTYHFLSVYSLEHTGFLWHRPLCGPVRQWPIHRIFDLFGIWLILHVNNSYHTEKKYKCFHVCDVSVCSCVCESGLSSTWPDLACLNSNLTLVQKIYFSVCRNVKNICAHKIMTVYEFQCWAQLQISSNIFDVILWKIFFTLPFLHFNLFCTSKTWIVFFYFVCLFVGTYCCCSLYWNRLSIEGERWSKNDEPWHKMWQREKNSHK